jgi:hypothetical protein
MAVGIGFSTAKKPSFGIRSTPRKARRKASTASGGHVERLARVVCTIPPLSGAACAAGWRAVISGLARHRYSWPCHTLGCSQCQATQLRLPVNKQQQRTGYVGINDCIYRVKWG